MMKKTILKKRFCRSMILPSADILMVLTCLTDTLRWLSTVDMAGVRDIMVLMVTKELVATLLIGQPSTQVNLLKRPCSSTIVKLEVHSTHSSLLSQLIRSINILIPFQ